MCTQGQCMRQMGNWVQFRTPWGMHQGIISEVNNRGVLMRVPRQYAPVGLACHSGENGSDEKRLDVALAGIGYGGYGGYPGAYGGAYGGRWGYPGAGAWSGGWWWWWLAFAWIFWLAFLW